MTASTAPIGVFDSGVGGVSVLTALRQLLPNEDLLYVADSAYAPYGHRSEEFIRARCRVLSEFLLRKQVKAIVVACNTATAYAIEELRQRYRIPVIGMEPAVKPAANLSSSGRVGILATENTLNSRRFKSLLAQYAQGKQLVLAPCPGLVEQIEQGVPFGAVARKIIERSVKPLVHAQVDTLVLGCTHYPLVASLIHDAMGTQVNIIDTGAAVAKQVERRLQQNGLLHGSNRAGREMFWTSGDPEKTGALIEFFWGAAIQVEALHEA